MIKNKRPIQITFGLALLVFAIGPGSGRAQAQVLGADFVGEYAFTNVSAPIAVPPYFGGLEFKAGDPNTLLFLGDVEAVGGTVHEVGVIRDSDGHITDFDPAVTVLATAPECSCCTYGPNGVLFYTTWPTNTLCQIKPGSTFPDKIIDLTALGMAVSSTGVNVVPSGFPGAGNLKIGSYDTSLWYDAQLVADANGTYDIVGLTNTTICPTPGGSIYIDPSQYPGFTVDSIAVVFFDGGTVDAYEIDANGDPVFTTRRTFIDWQGVDEQLGAVMDPSTGDLLFSGYNGGEVTVVKRAEFSGTSFCSGDGSNATCPCGNSGNADHGCANGADAMGAKLAASGSASVSAANMVLSASGLVPNQPGLYFQGNNAINGGMGVAFGDGLRCAGGAVIRLQVRFADGAGSSATSIDVAANGGVAPGDVKRYQIWYRDPGTSLCGAGFNLSNGMEVTWGA
ncbi:MAG: hypothetical protein OSB14_01435 [Planctomycetota bacterium]|nr:hypothetical protein [Planctomycetota bacterium]